MMTTAVLRRPMPRAAPRLLRRGYGALASRLGAQDLADGGLQLAVQDGIVFDEDAPGHLDAFALAFEHQLEAFGIDGQQVRLSPDPQVQTHLHAGCSRHDPARRASAVPSLCQPISTSAHSVERAKSSADRAPLRRIWE